MKKLVNQLINEIFRQMTITLTLALDVPVCPMDAKGLSIQGTYGYKFKLHLDRFLATVPDEPQVRGYTAMRRAESNSLLHIAQLAGL